MAYVRFWFALIHSNWGGGKRGFQFLPIPDAEADPYDYQGAAGDLLDVILDGTKGDPRCLLVGNDRAFYDSLPDRITVYRGVSGISAELAEMGVCWTTKRETAEWFAHRWSDDENKPLVVKARVRKKDVVLVSAADAEIVCQPRRAQEIECRVQTKRPDMGWTAPAEMQVAA